MKGKDEKKKDSKGSHGKVKCDLREAVVQGI